MLPGFTQRDYRLRSPPSSTASSPDAPVTPLKPSLAAKAQWHSELGPRGSSSWEGTICPALLGIRSGHSPFSSSHLLWWQLFHPVCGVKCLCCGQTQCCEKVNWLSECWRQSLVCSFSSFSLSLCFSLMLSNSCYLDAFFRFPKCLVKRAAEVRNYFGLLKNWVVSSKLNVLFSQPRVIPNLHDVLW